MEKVRENLNILEYIAYGIILILLLPYFFAIALADSPQLRDASLVLIFSTLVISISYSIKPKKPIFSYKSIGILALAYLSLLLSHFSIFFLLGALVLTLSSVAMLFLDKENFKLAYAFGAGFYSYCLLLVMSAFFDFPLRFFAGVGASKLLGFFGISNKLLIFKKGIHPIILSCPSKGDFLVATECNGLSILASSLVLSLFIAVFSSFGVLKKIFYVIFAILFAYAMNVLRICSIVMLNPVVGKENYFLMHEIVGYTFSISTLAVIYLISKIFARKALS